MSFQTTAKMQKFASKAVQPMFIASEWLKNYIDHDQDPDSLAKILTNTGLEVEGVETFVDRPPYLESLIIGKIQKVESHPDADNLSVTKVDTGNNEPDQIICGAPNVAEGQKVVVAPVGSTIQNSNGEQLTVKKSKIRGVRSYGMIVAEDEIGLSHHHDGIIVLDEGAPVGQYFIDYKSFATQKVLEISLTPNRGDAASHIGVARDLSAYLNKPLKQPDYSGFQVNQTGYPITIHIDNHALCPRYSGLVIQDVQVNPSPDWLQQNLKAVGIQPINNIVDITNYVMMEGGHPLHAFDYDQIKGDTIQISKAEKGKSFHMLDGEHRTLTGDELMIADKEQHLAMAGIMGGAHSAVSEGTTSIFLESAYFNPTTIRKAATQHHLITDASFRFERGTDPEATIKALKRAAYLIQAVAGGSIASEIIDAYPEPLEPVKLDLSFDYLFRLLGDQVPIDQVQQILSRLGFTILNLTEKAIALEVPTFRPDVTRPVDVVEEIIRIYSLNALGGETIPSLRLAQQYDHIDEQLRQRLAGYLTAQGYFEMITLPFTSQQTEEELLGEVSASNPVQIVNPLNQEQDCLRTTTLLNGLEAISYNLRRKQRNLKLFELARVYRQAEHGPVEDQKLSLFLTGQYHAPSWYQAAKEVDFYYLKAIIQNLLQMAGISGWSEKEIDHPELTFGLALNHENGTLASLGSVEPHILKAYDLKQPVLYANIELDGLLKRYRQTTPQYSAISKFPAIERDLAVLIPEQVPYQAVRETIQDANIPELKSLQLFDVYKGERVKEGYKSLAVRVTLQDEEKTMEDERVDEIVNQLFKNLEELVGAEARQ